MSEIEFWAPYAVDGQSPFACILRFEDAKTDYSDTLIPFRAARMKAPSIARIWAALYVSPAHHEVKRYRVAHLPNSVILSGAPHKLIEWHSSAARSRRTSAMPILPMLLAAFWATRTRVTVVSTG